MEGDPGRGRRSPWKWSVGDSLRVLCGLQLLSIKNTSQRIQVVLSQNLALAVAREVRRGPQKSSICLVSLCRSPLPFILAACYGYFHCAASVPSCRLAAFDRRTTSLSILGSSSDSA
jgi:hypothetical protein